MRRPPHPAALALRALVDGLTPHEAEAAEPAELYRALVALVLRWIWLRSGEDSPADLTWPGLRARFDRQFAADRSALFDPAAFPLLATLELSDAAIQRARLLLDPAPQLGAAHEALMALQLTRKDGALVLQLGSERRRSGTHYTPEPLTRPLVAATLRPLLAELGAHPTPQQLLALRVLDPAMGCGAFLLAAADLLAEHLLRAWDHHGAPSVPDLSRHARREIASHCLHGVDLDPLAVELARRSLWLHVADPTLPPTALDRSLRHGDSLVGLDPAQISAFSWTPDPHDPTARDPTDLALDKLRGDALLSAFFTAATPRAREHARTTLRPLADRARTDPLARAELTRRVDLPVRPFHWALELPDVFTGPDPGFDLVIGNPPFFWGNRIGRHFGPGYRDWLQQLHPGAHGNTDLAAHFLRRAFGLLRRGGCLGFITTNSISEAETRATGLEHVLARGGEIFAATRDLAWPGEASVRVASVCLRRGPVAAPLLDGREVTAIGPDLRPLQADPRPARLPARAGQSFKGVDFGGTGFLLASAARDALLRIAPDEADAIWPVLNASGLTTSPTLAPDGHIINFSGRTLAEAAAAAPRCLEHVRREVLPRRLEDRRSGRRARWWLYNEACPGLYRAISGLPRVLVGPVVAKHLVFAFVAPRTVFTNALNVFAFASDAALAILQSRVHELWALHHASSLRCDPRYNPTTCFATFPFPPDWDRCPALASAGKAYDEHRAALMRRRDEGLTLTYNRFHDPAEAAPDIAELRALHAALDRAVLRAHGWSDLAAAAACAPQQDPGGRWRLRWPQPLADEVLTRLRAANRAAAPVLQASS